MDDGKARHGADPVMVLAALLQALAESADGEQGGQLWEGLTALTHRPIITGASGRVQLNALRQAPGDRHLAEGLARILLVRASTDGSFRSALDVWRSQDQVRLVENWMRPAVREALAQATAGKTSPDAHAGPLWKKVANKPLVWLAGLATAAATAIVLPLATNVGQHIGDKILPPTAPVVIGGSPPALLHDPALADQAPFGWTVSRTNGLADCASWVFPKPISAIPVRTLNGFANAAADEVWVLRNGGADVEGGAYTITLQGKTFENVDIENIRVKIISRKPARKGTDITSALLCPFGGIIVRSFTVALNRPGRHLIPQAGVQSWPYTISATDIEQLCLGAYLDFPDGKYEYSYVYEIDWAQGNRMGTAEILAPNGKPFTAVPASYAPLYYNNNGKWTRADG